MRSATNSILAGIIAGIMGVVFATSYASIIFSGDLLAYLPNGIGITLFSATVMSAFVALASSYPGAVAMPQDVSSVIFGVAAAAIAVTLTPTASGEVIFATIVTALVLTAVVTGLVFFALGYFRLGGLIRFIPYPVIAGFLAGTGWLLVKAAVGLMAGLSPDLSTMPELFKSEMLGLWLPGMVFGAALFVITRRISHHLVFPAIMIGAILLFHLYLLVSGTPVAEAGARGWLLGPFDADAQWSPVTPALFAAADWGAVFAQIPAIATITMLSVIGLLLNASALEIAMERDMDLNRELRCAGIGNLLAALGGGMSGHHYLSLTVLSRRIGGETRLVGITVAVVCGCALLLGADVLSYLPKLVLGGVIAYLGFAFLVEWLHDVRGKLPTFDYLIVLLIFIVASSFGFLEGVVVGVLASSVLFIVNYSRIDVVRHTLSGAMYRSNIARPKPQADMLQEQGGALLILKLQGFIFFGTAKRLADRLDQRAQDIEAPLRYVVVDFTMVDGFDSSAIMSFVKLRQLAQAHGFMLVLTHLAPALRDQLEACGFSLEEGASIMTFSELDRGVEWCEDMQLRAESLEPEVEHEAVMDILRHGFPADLDVAEMLAFLDRQTAVEGQHLMRQGEGADDLYFIESGRLTVQLELEEGEIVRLLSTGLGTVGEVSLYTGGLRTASVVADKPSVVYRLTAESLRRMEQEKPQLAAAFHRFIARHLASRLADTTRVLQAVLS